MKKNLKKIVVILCLILGILYGIQVIKTVSRYIYNSIKEMYLKSNNFYFNSDKLKAEKAEYNIENWSGIEDYIININMNSIENNNVKCDSDIAYNITCTVSDNILYQISKTTSTIYADENTDNFVVTITPKTTLETGEKVWIEVEAKSTYPYEKTLSARFEITIGNLGMSYNIEDDVGNQFLEFNVINTLNFYTIDESFDDYQQGTKIDMYKYLELSEENKAKCHSMIITLNFNPQQVLVDMTSEIYLKTIEKTSTTIDGKSYINSITFKVDAISSESIKFYKRNLNENYTYPNGNNQPIINITYR